MAKKLIIIEGYRPKLDARSGRTIKLDPHQLKPPKGGSAIQPPQTPSNGQSQENGYSK